MILTRPVWTANAFHGSVQDTFVLVYTFIPFSFSLFSFFDMRSQCRPGSVRTSLERESSNFLPLLSSN